MLQTDDKDRICTLSETTLNDGTLLICPCAREEFSPTDFHSATLVGNVIFIVGGLGYPEQRVEGRTPVFRLELETMVITPVEASGEAPGLIHRHSAELDADGCSIVIRGGELWLGPGRSMQENIDTWSLNVANGHWTRLSQLDWQRWTMLRVDRKPNRLWDLRQELCPTSASRTFSAQRSRHCNDSMQATGK